MALGKYIGHEDKTVAVPGRSPLAKELGRDMPGEPQRDGAPEVVGAGRGKLQRPLPVIAGLVPVAVLVRDIPQAEVRFFDTGHFALETHAAEIAAAIRDFPAGSIGS